MTIQRCPLRPLSLFESCRPSWLCALTKCSNFLKVSLLLSFGTWILFFSLFAILNIKTWTLLVLIVSWRVAIPVCKPFGTCGGDGWAFLTPLIVVELAALVVGRKYELAQTGLDEQLLLISHHWLCPQDHCSTAGMRSGGSSQKVKCSFHPPVVCNPGLGA